MRTLHTLPLGLTLLAAACGNQTGSTTNTCQALTKAPATPTKDWGGTVFTIVMENKSKGAIIGNNQAPFINQLVSQNVLASGYHDSYVHPSEPNYIWMASGENFGILNDNDPGPTNHIGSTSHIADQLEAAGLSWKTYQESMGQPCGLASKGTYAAKHNPFIYFDDINGWDGKAVHVTQRCTDHVVDYSELDKDLASGNVPKYVFITPNLQSDMHDGTIADGDAWLARELPKILESDAFNKGGVVFLLWDEGSSTLGINPADDPPFIVISPNGKRGFVSQTVYDTSSYLKTVEQILGLPELPCVANGSTVQAMDDLFTVPLTSGGTPSATTPDGGTPTPPATATTPAATTPTATTPAATTSGTTTPATPSTVSTTR